MVEVGLRLRHASPSMDEEHQSLIETARDGLTVLVSFLLGFSLLMAQPHYEQRKQLVIDEANAIATVDQRAQMLPEPFRGKILQSLREYVDARIEFANDELDEHALLESIAHAKHLQNEMWQQSVTLVQQNPNVVTPIFAQALGALADMSEQRRAAEEKRIPGAIWLVLILISVLACFTFGYSMKRRLLLTMSVLPLTVAIVLSLVSELDSPRTGFIRPGQQSMERLQLDLRMGLGAGQTAAPNPAGSRPLEGTYWKAIELAGKSAPTQDATREVHLLFQAGGRVSGSDGCNRVTGSYELKGDVVTFGQMVGTQMACVDTGEIERAFRDALKVATRLTIVGDRLELFDVTGNRVAAFTARAQTSLPSTTPELEGTSWQLVKFQGGDDTTLAPDDGAKYTIEFDAGGRLTARIDCNRGRGTWKSNGSNQLLFGPLALTRAKCPAGSLHDQIVKRWGYIRSYMIKDGHLFLSLMADGGIYEFEPVTETKP